MNPKKKIKKELTPEAQSIRNWVSKKKIRCQWIEKTGSNMTKLAMLRGRLTIHSELMTKEKRDSLTYEEMKQMLSSMYRQLVEKEGATNA